MPLLPLCICEHHSVCVKIIFLVGTANAVRWRRTRIALLFLEEYNSGSQLVSQDPKMAAGLFCHEEEGK